MLVATHAPAVLRHLADTILPRELEVIPQHVERNPWALTARGAAAKANTELKAMLTFIFFVG
jgi:hypothetical protein